MFEAWEATTLWTDSLRDVLTSHYSSFENVTCEVALSKLREKTSATVGSCALSVAVPLRVIPKSLLLFFAFQGLQREKRKSGRFSHQTEKDFGDRLKVRVASQVPKWNELRDCPTSLAN